MRSPLIYYLGDIFLIKHILENVIKWNVNPALSINLFRECSVMNPDDTLNL